MRVVSWNVNGIRAGVRHGFVDFVDRSGADIVGVQEVRARPEDIPPAARRPPGWHTAFTVAERRGYSGVGIYSKLQPVRVDTSLGVPRFDREGRFMAGHFQTARGRFVVVNGYFPKGSGPGPGQQPGRLQARLLSDGLRPGARTPAPGPGARDRRLQHGAPRDRPGRRRRMSRTAGSSPRSGPNSTAGSTRAGWMPFAPCIPRRLTSTRGGGSGAARASGTSDGGSTTSSHRRLR